MISRAPRRILNDLLRKHLFCFGAILLFACAVGAQVSFVQQGKLIGADGAAQDALGFAAAIDGDTAVVGAPRASGGSGLQARGAAYVYVRNATGEWTFQQKLAPSDGAATDQFGYAVAISGNTIAVGRYNTTTGQNRSDGRVYVFTRSGNVWAQTQILQSNDIAQGDSFGYALALENDTLAVGARNKQDGTTFFKGAAYIFTRSGAGAEFTQQAKLSGSDTGANDFFGESIALSGETAVVGSVNDFGTANNNGKAYVFVRNGSQWSEQQILQAAAGSPAGAFGVSVSVSGDYALIGANTEVVNQATGELGAAYVFARSGGVWTEQQRFTAQELTPRNDRFGAAVAIRGDTFAVGSPAHEIVSNIANHGAVYVYRRSGASWGRAQKIVHNDPNPDALGQSLAFDGNSLLAGAPSKDSARGAAYVFKTIPTNGQSKIVPPEVFINPLFGMSIGMSEDTTAIGSNLGTYVYTRRGAAWEFTQKLPFFTENGGANNITPGSSIAFSGNMMFVSAAGARINNANLRGAVMIYTRNASGIWVEQQRLLASDGAGGDQFGTSIAVSGNTLIVGALRDMVGANAGQGSAYIFTFNGATWSEQAKITASDGAANDQFGARVAVSGETIVVGVPAKTVGANSGQGASYVFTRSGTTWSEQQKITAADGAGNDQFGSALAVEGDTIVVGAQNARNASNNFQGAAYVFNRAGNTWNLAQRIVDPNGQAVDQFGIDVAIKGERIYVGASAVDYPPDWYALGAVVVFGRSGNAWNYLGKLQPFDADHNKQMGYRIAIAGNYVAATAMSERIYGVTGAGAAYVFDMTQISFNTTAGAADFDFDGDGKSDFGVFRAASGNWFMQRSTNGFAALNFGVSTDKIVPADYDGDGKTDIAVWRESDGNFYILQSSDNAVRSEHFGAAGDVPMPGDWDGDGKADLAVYRDGAQSYFFYRASANNPNGDIVSINWGTSGDLPVRGDCDGDGRTDAAVFRPSDGVWYIRNSSDGAMRFENWGIAGDKPVAADYDGDGKNDLAVFRGGTWHIKQSSNNQTRHETFGVASDTPAAADFDGDGRADIAVYRGGLWCVRQSSSGAVSYQTFGTGGDRPVSAAFVQ